ncbi:MAG: RagB/SusD family nutrient uptake outer membrane protein [Bacteroides sp.]|nr:RagB/SusD family nutrient uptake outer membrane protein [Bacteroides sp.]
MKKYIFALFSAAALTFTACDDVLDRPQLTAPEDTTYWTAELNLRLFANGFYENYFVGYNSGWGTAYTPLRGYTFSDDLVSTGKQTNFTSTVPTSQESTSKSPSMLSQHWGPTWNFHWVRKSNLFIDRIETMAKPYITDEAYKHWIAVARFFRGYEYSRLTSVFGDFPYQDKVLADNDYDELYKDRTPRADIMDKVYDDFEYVLGTYVDPLDKQEKTNIRTNDGDQYVNRYIAAAVISRLMLYEGTWQKYHEGDDTRAEKYLKMAVDAAEIVMNSGKYKFTSDFRSLFGSQDLAGNEEVIMYRHYDSGLSVRHCIASYSNRNESQTPSCNLSLAKSFICADGQPYQLSSLTDAAKLDITSMIQTRDPRFEATFWNEPMTTSSSLLYATKFIDRVGPTYYKKTVPAIYGSNTNTNDYPVLRLAEVVLNWIEAKAELAESYGGAAITQSDLDASINAIRNRPLDDEAIAKGIQKTTPMDINAIPNDPARDADVSTLLWEIRRERRMEFVYEHARLLDLKRWKKLHYMNCTLYPDNLKGLWIDVEKELRHYVWTDKVENGVIVSTEPATEKKGKLKVMKEDGTVVTYDGTNQSEMVGFFMVENASDRDEFTDKSYLQPVGQQQIDQYAQKGYTLTQTKGW